MKPTDLEVNKKLAEYEGLEIEVKEGVLITPTSDRWWIPLKNYTESLDAQIPIMEKKRFIFSVTHTDEIEKGEPTTPIDGMYRVHINEIGYHCEAWADGDTIAQASAYALYYAILESEK